jgi:Prokaryotic metallothionein
MSHQICSHPGCGCAIELGKAVSLDGVEYCSEYCAQSGVSISANCKCGHAECDEEGKFQAEPDGFTHEREPKGTT